VHAHELVLSTAPKINAIGAKFMLIPETNEIGAGLGFTHPFAFYTAGRGGVLGDVDADVIISSFGFFAPGLIRKFWDSSKAVLSPRQAGTEFARAAQQWGRHHLAGVDGLERLSELGERVIDAADCSALALFAGWRAEPLPTDAEGRAYQILHVLREHRGSAHIVALLAAGLSPFQAHYGKTGEAGLKNFGWRDWRSELLDVAGIEERLSRAELLTTELITHAFEVLTDDEADEFDTLVDRVFTHTSPPTRS
jgi:hypothetical protein